MPSRSGGRVIESERGAELVRLHAAPPSASVLATASSRAEAPRCAVSLGKYTSRRPG